MSSPNQICSTPACLSVAISSATAEAAIGFDLVITAGNSESESISAAAVFSRGCRVTALRTTLKTHSSMYPEYMLDYEISPSQLASILAEPEHEQVVLLDVREPHEYKIAQIGGHLIPLGDLQKRVGELDRDREIVAHCKMGGRSQKAAEFLQQAGFKVKNLAGGITAWSDQIDPRVPKY